MNYNCGILCRRSNFNTANWFQISRQLQLGRNLLGLARQEEALLDRTIMDPNKLQVQRGSTYRNNTNKNNVRRTEIKFTRSNDFVQSLRRIEVAERTENRMEDRRIKRRVPASNTDHIRRSNTESDSSYTDTDGSETEAGHRSGRRVSWADELVTVHEYTKDKKPRTFSWPFLCMPRFSI